MRGVYEIRGPGAPRLPLVLDSPHSGNRFPEDFDAAVAEADLREAEDCYVDELWGAAPALGVPLLAAHFPRTYIDPNRHAGDVDPDLIEGDWPGALVPSGKARIGKSLVWRTLEDGRPIYARRLRPEEVRRRIEDLAPGGGFIFNTVHNIQADVPPKNILAMWEALQEYGRYRG